MRNLSLCLFLCALVAVPVFASEIQTTLSKREQRGRSGGIAKKVKAAAEQKKAAIARADCDAYEPELKEAKLDRAAVKRFREDYLFEHYTELLGAFDMFWNHVYQTWLKADEAGKQVIVDFRRDWRQRVWYHQKDDAYTRETGMKALREEYKPRFKKFAEKYFIIEPFPFALNPYAWQVRRGQADVVFPPGSVIELEDGELSVARYSRVQLPKDLGGFILHLKIRNDVYASRIKQVSQRGNYHLKQPEMNEVLASARRWSKVDDDDADHDRNEDRLELLLDERFERCEPASAAKR